jgi:hypothetical protein
MEYLLKLEENVAKPKKRAERLYAYVDGKLFSVLADIHDAKMEQRVDIGQSVILLPQQRHKNRYILWPLSKEGKIILREPGYGYLQPESEAAKERFSEAIENTRQLIGEEGMAQLFPGLRPPTARRIPTETDIERRKDLIRRLQQYIQSQMLCLTAERRQCLNIDLRSIEVKDNRPTTTTTATKDEAPFEESVYAILEHPHPHLIVRGLVWPLTQESVQQIKDYLRQNNYVPSLLKKELQERAYGNTQRITGERIPQRPNAKQNIWRRLNRYQVKLCEEGFCIQLDLELTRHALYQQDDFIIVNNVLWPLSEEDRRLLRSFLSTSATPSFQATVVDVTRAYNHTATVLGSKEDVRFLFPHLILYQEEATRARIEKTTPYSTSLRVNPERIPRSYKKFRVDCPDEEIVIEPYGASVPFSLHLCPRDWRRWEFLPDGTSRFRIRTEDGNVEWILFPKEFTKRLRPRYDEAMRGGGDISISPPRPIEKRTAAHRSPSPIAKRTRLPTEEASLPTRRFRARQRGERPLPAQEPIDLTFTPPMSPLRRTPRCPQPIRISSSTTAEQVELCPQDMSTINFSVDQSTNTITSTVRIDGEEVFIDADTTGRLYWQENWLSPENRIKYGRLLEQL